MTETPLHKGFEKKLLTRHEVALLREHFACYTTRNIVTGEQPWSRNKILTVMGVLNSYLYRAAEEAKCLIRVQRSNERRKGFHKITNQIKDVAVKGIKKFTLATSAVRDYLKEHWKGANAGRTAIWKIQDLLSTEFNLFNIEAKFTPGKRGLPTVVRNFDVAKALILYEHLESLLATYHEDEWEDGQERPSLSALPKHRGMIPVLMFNRLFSGVIQYRRQYDTEVREEVEEPPFDPVVLREGNRKVCASEMDWAVGDKRSDRTSFWIGSSRVCLVKGEDGVYRFHEEMFTTDDPIVLADYEFAQRQLEQKRNELLVPDLAAYAELPY